MHELFNEKRDEEEHLTGIRFPGAVSGTPIYKYLFVE
jgi:hypothetical protein